MIQYGQENDRVTLKLKADDVDECSGQTTSVIKVRDVIEEYVNMLPKKAAQGFIRANL